MTQSSPWPPIRFCDGEFGAALEALGKAALPEYAVAPVEEPAAQLMFNGEPDRRKSETRLSNLTDAISWAPRLWHLNRLKDQGSSSWRPRPWGK